MVTKEELYYDSRDRETKIYAIRWIPEEKPRAILQISHGMVEYVDRYDEFARFMAERGILVVGNDHLGHGCSVKSKEDFGYFCERDSATVVVRDIHRLKKMTQEKYPGIPCYLLGHSMGSFLARYYITIYGKGIDGVILLGTGNKSTGLVNAGLILVNILKTLRGSHFRSKLLKNMAFKGYNSRFEPRRTDFDWISSDQAIVDFYCGEERCQFDFTVNGYYTLFNTIKYINNDSSLKSIPNDLPVLFAAGKDDPVGDYGKGVEAVYNRYLELGMKDVSLKLYDGGRHELINELNRQEVYQDIYDWLEKHLQ